MASKPSERVTVAVIFGGVSSEHDVSCLTAGGVTRAIDRDRFDTIGVGITPGGRWVQVSSEEMAGMEIVDHKLPRLTEERPGAVVLPGPRGGQIATRDGDRLIDVHDFDVAFTLLHGPFGEDGTIQGLFEMMGIRYVGAGVASSAVGMDKDLMKRSLAAAGLPVAPWVTIHPRHWAADHAPILKAIDQLRFPVYVKPARGGSSMGISRVATPDALAAAIEEAQRFDPKVLVEEGFIGAREIELAVLGGPGGSAPRVSLPGEIRMHTEDAFYDFEAKYLPQSQVSLDVPADIDEQLLGRLQEMAGLAFEALGCEGLARVDLFVSKEGQVFVNEINTMPGFTRTSMFPSMWAVSGLTYPEVITALIELALERPMGLR